MIISRIKHSAILIKIKALDVPVSVSGYKSMSHPNTSVKVRNYLNTIFRLHTTYPSLLGIYHDIT